MQSGLWYSPWFTSSAARPNKPVRYAKKNRMNTLQKTQLVTQIISAAGLLITLSMYYLQLRTMAKQLASMQRSADAQQILSLLNFIESDEMRVAREVVYTTLHRKHFSEWTESELHA